MKTHRNVDICVPLCKQHEHSQQLQHNFLSFHLFRQTSNLTHANGLLQYVFVWPYCWHLAHCMMLFLLTLGGFICMILFCSSVMFYTGCPRRNVKYFGRVFLMLNYTDITENTYIPSWMVTEIMAREFWNFDSCYTLIDYQIHIENGRNMWFP